MDTSTTLRNPTEKGEWVANNPDSIMSYWPRRDAALREGTPNATFRYTVQELLDMNFVGIYLDEDIPEGLLSREILDKPRRK
jgi:hypothetical protein